VRRLERSRARKDKDEQQFCDGLHLNVSFIHFHCLN